MLRAHNFSTGLAGWRRAPLKRKQWRIELLYQYKRAKTSRITVLNIRKLYLYFAYFKLYCLYEPMAYFRNFTLRNIKIFTFLTLSKCYQNAQQPPSYNITEQTRHINRRTWRIVFTWLWGWPPLRSSKRQSLSPTVFLKTTLGSNYLLYQNVTKDTSNNFTYIDFVKSGNDRSLDSNFEVVIETVVMQVRSHMVDIVKYAKAEALFAARAGWVLAISILPWKYIILPLIKS